MRVQWSGLMWSAFLSAIPTLILTWAMRVQWSGLMWSAFLSATPTLILTAGHEGAVVWVDVVSIPQCYTNIDPNLGHEGAVVWVDVVSIPQCYTNIDPNLGHEGAVVWVDVVSIPQCYTNIDPNRWPLYPSPFQVGKVLLFLHFNTSFYCHTEVGRV